MRRLFVVMLPPVLPSRPGRAAQDLHQGRLLAAGVCAVQRAALGLLSDVLATLAVAAQLVTLPWSHAGRDRDARPHHSGSHNHPAHAGHFERGFRAARRRNAVAGAAETQESDTAALTAARTDKGQRTKD